MYFTPEELEEAREHADDDGRYGFCGYCECENPIVEQEQGFDHAFGFHSLPTEVCAKCGERI